MWLKQETTCGADEKCVTVIEIGGGQTARCEKKEGSIMRSL